MGVGFHLGLHLREYALLAQLQSTFVPSFAEKGIGKLYKYEHKDEAHYAITSVSELK